MGLKQKIVSSVTRVVSRLMGGLSQDENGGTVNAEPFVGMPEAARACLCPPTAKSPSSAGCRPIGSMSDTAQAETSAPPILFRPSRAC